MSKETIEVGNDTTMTGFFSIFVLYGDNNNACLTPLECSTFLLRALGLGLYTAAEEKNRDNEEYQEEEESVKQRQLIVPR